MLALVKKFAKPGLWKENIKTPKVGENDVLIKIKKTAICGTDVHIYKWDDWAQKTIPVPLQVGHEYVGEIHEIGKLVHDLNIGDRVSGEGHIVCGNCRNCRAGLRHLCVRTKGIGVNLPGAFAEYLLLPATNVFKLPKEISDDEASILDPLGNAVHTALSFDLVGEDVLVTGAGPIGILAAVVAKHVGSKKVVITDINPYRLELAKKLGIEFCINTQEENLDELMNEIGMTEGFDIGLEMSGAPVAFRQMIEKIRAGGKLALLGILPSDTQIPWESVIFKGLFLKGIYGREMYETWYKMVSLLQSGLDIKKIITHKFPVEEYEEAFEIMCNGNSGKIILEW